MFLIIVFETTFKFAGNMATALPEELDELAFQSLLIVHCSVLSSRLFESKVFSICKFSWLARTAMSRESAWQMVFGGTKSTFFLAGEFNGEENKKPSSIGSSSAPVF